MSFWNRRPIPWKYLLGDYPLHQENLNCFYPIYASSGYRAYVFTITSAPFEGIDYFYVISIITHLI